jgi:hypothetical protein
MLALFAFGLSWVQDAPSWSHWTSKGVVRTAVGAGRLHRFILQEPWTAARDGVEDIAAAVASLGAGVSGGSSGSGAGPSGAGSAGSGGAALPVEPPQPSLAFAALCLRNALSLLPPVSSFAPPSPADASAPVASSVDSLPFATAGALHASVPRTDAGPISAAGSAVDARKKPADGEDDGTAGAGADSASDPKDSKAVPPKSKVLACSLWPLVAPSALPLSPLRVHATALLSPLSPCPHLPACPSPTAVLASSCPRQVVLRVS